MTNNANYQAQIAALQARAALTEGATKDLARVLNPANLQYGFTETTLEKGEELGVDWSLIWALPQKQIFRTTQMINALVSGKRTHLDYTHARILCAMRLAGEYDLCTDALAHLAAGSRSAGDANLRGVTSAAVNAMFAQSHKMGTVQTKVSNMTGKNGFSQVLGMTFADPSKQNHTISLNTAHPVCKAFFKLIDSSTIGQIQEMNAEGAKG